MLGVFLLAHGGPGSLEDVPAFLEHVRGGRPSSDALLDDVREKYRLIGGASPLPDITRSSAEKLQRACGLPVYVGMRHWHPFLEDTVSQMVLDGVTRALVICLVPHFSQPSVGRYHERATSAASEPGLALDFVDSWHTLSPYIDGLADSVVAARKTLGDGPRARVQVIFSAHSLPKAALPEGDPYELQLRETAYQVAGRLGLPEQGWALAYQSVSSPAEDWLGPSVDELVLELSEQGVNQVVLCPFGFVADQMEILYDLDVSTKQKAKDLGVALARTPLLNDGPALIESLALLVEQWKDERGA